MAPTVRTGTKRRSKPGAADIATAVGAGRPLTLPTVDFADPRRPLTCLEVDFPILPVNQVAAIEGNAGKPIYQMSKWWARRRSSVFRSMLIAAATKAPDDPARAAAMVWDAYYANHQPGGAFANLRVADIFMGGGTTLVEGSRLGMKVWGTDLNPVAWLVVKNELAQVAEREVAALLAAVEAEVKPQLMPLYACDCPRGHRGTWTHVGSDRVMPTDFDPLGIPRAERGQYRYEGPEIVYVFWAKHGPCQVSACGHRTPLFSSPVIAIKTLTVKAWLGRACPACKREFDVEGADARMAPSVPLVVADTEAPFGILDRDHKVTCPHCRARVQIALGGEKAVRKKIELSLLVHPSYLAGSPGTAPDGRPLGGSVTDDPASTAAWNAERASRLRLLEVRGALPESVTCPETQVAVPTATGTIPRRSTFQCGSCGNPQDVMGAIKGTKKSAPVAPYAIQGFCPTCKQSGTPYEGRFFATPAGRHPFATGAEEWFERNETDLARWWPRSEVPYGFMTCVANSDIRVNYGYTHWWTMFNPRQLLVHTQMLRAITTVGGDRHRWEAREFVLGAFQQYLRNQSMFSFWHLSHDHFAPMLSNSNFHPKSTVVEVGVFTPVGYGPWPSTTSALVESSNWAAAPWELVSLEWMKSEAHAGAGGTSGKSEKVACGDPVVPGAEVATASATDLSTLASASFDLVITDPPFGGLLHYSELSDFFYVWLRLALKDRYPEVFSAEYTPKALEVVSNRARQPEDPDGFYRRLLTECWREASRILKPGGTMAFTFHHSEDEPWVAVLEALFEAGFYLVATYPIRSDETKGEGEFGSRKIEYDIIHVCRKRLDAPTRVSWPRLRREIVDEVRRLQGLLELHANAGLAAADLQVIKRGKALEFYSRHYGQVFVDDGRPRPMSVQEAVLGVIQLLDEEGSKGEPPPIEADPFTRQFLRLFDGMAEQPKDQVQKLLRGTGVAPDEFVTRGWCTAERKGYRVRPPLELAQDWVGRHRHTLVADYDQAMVLIGACVEGSGINAMDTLRNPNFEPHAALGPLLDWHVRHAGAADVKQAASRARAIHADWLRSLERRPDRPTLFPVE